MISGRPKPVNFVALSIVGKERGSKSSLNTVVQIYKNFTPGWKWDRRGHVKPEVMPPPTRDVSPESLLPRASCQAFRRRPSLYPSRYPALGTRLGHV